MYIEKRKDLDFDLDRVVFDRSVWVCYFPSIVKDSENCRYDPDLIERLDLERELKTTKWRGAGTEKVLFYQVGEPKPYLKIDMRLRASRSMNVVFNFNRYFFQKFNMKHDIKMPVIHDDNFLPQDSSVTTQDYLDIFFKTLPREIETIYREKFRLLWPKQYNFIEENAEECIIKCVTLEVAREMSPLNVSDVQAQIDMNSAPEHISSFNSQSKSIAFGARAETKEYFDDDDAILGANLETWNWKETYEHSRQAKLYQKSFNLARFEVTLYDDQIDFNSQFPLEDLMFILDDASDACGLFFKSEKKTWEETKIFLAESLGFDVSVIDSIIQNNYVWTSNYENRVITRKLKKRKIIVSSGFGRSGRYVCNPVFLKLFQDCQYEKKKQETDYIPKYL